MVKYKYVTENGGYNEVTDLAKIPNGVIYETIEFDPDENSNAEKIEKFTDLLKEKVSELRIKAKGLAIGKTGTNAYILAQVDFYQRKYENAIAVIPVPEIDEDLEAEGFRDFNLELPDFKDLIISMYNQGKESENLLMSFIEQGRSAILTLINLQAWENVETAFELISELKGITTVDQARYIKNQILDL